MCWALGVRSQHTVRKQSPETENGATYFPGSGLCGQPTRKFCDLLGGQPRVRSELVAEQLRQFRMLDGWQWLDFAGSGLNGDEAFLR